MKALLKRSSATSTDARIFIATLIVVTMWLAMVVAGMTGYLTPVELVRSICFWAQMGAAGILIAVFATYAPIALHEMHDRHHMTAVAVEARRQVEQLFKMTDMLQSAGGYGDANAVLRATMANLLPDFGGALYVFKVVSRGVV